MYPLTVKLSETVGSIKEKLIQKTRVPINEQRLIKEGKQLQDNNKTLLEYGINFKDTIYFIIFMKAKKDDEEDEKKDL